MKYLILGLMLQKPLSLYELHTLFTTGFTHIYAASHGSIHRALKQLHAADEIELVEDATAARGTKRYLATDQGRRSWFAWMGQPRENEDSEASMLARVLLLGHLEDPQDRRDVLLALRRRAVQELEALRAVDAAAGAPGEETAVTRYPRAALDYGLRAGRNVVTWLDELLAELPAREETTEPPP